MRNILLTGIVIVALSGCAAIESSSTEGRVAAACRSYASALMVAAEHKDELSQDQINYINSVRPSAREICKDRDNYSRTAVTEIANIANRMIEIKNDVEAQNE